MPEREALARGVIWFEEVSFLPQYVTTYALNDDQHAGHAIKVDGYRFSKYVGLKAQVRGPVSNIGKELAAKNGTHFQPSPER
jgi:hypothetical protein